jgi:hypothetical protein
MRLQELFTKSISESGYNHGHADPRAPQLGADEKRDRKRAELQHELGHESNNIAITINGKTWKVVPGKGYADSREERAHLDHMRKWAERKSASTGKAWSVHLTGAPLSESASVGATSSANIATVANPGYANNANKKPVKSVNALDQNQVSLFGTPMETTKSASGKKAAIIKRR